MNETRTADRRAQRHWLTQLDEALTVNPEAHELLYERAVTLNALGDETAAEKAYLDLLEREPDDFWARRELGHLLMRQRRYVTAFAAIAQLSERFPDDATALADLATLLAIAGDLGAADAYYRRALRLAPHHLGAHRGLALVLKQLGQLQQADIHERAGDGDGAFFPRQFRGTAAAIPVLLCVSEAEGARSLHADRFLDDQIFAITTCIVERVKAADDLPPHALLVNGIGDADAAGPALTRLSRLIAGPARPVLNAPLAMLCTGRRAIAERLAGLSNVVTPRMLEVSPSVVREPDALARLADHGFVFPFLLRAAGYHCGKYLYRIDSFEAWADAVAELPAEPLLATEYVDTRTPDGLYHKFRVMVIGGRLYPVHLAFSRDWKVHYFRSDMNASLALRLREAEFLNAPQHVLGPALWEALEKIAEIVGLDYFGIDFALNAAGDMVVFEANAAMVVARPGKQSQWAYRWPSYERVLRAATQVCQAAAQPRR